MKGILIFITTAVIATISTTTISTKLASRRIKYRSFSNEMISSCIVVDCTHAHNKQITHHLKYSHQKSLSLDINQLGDSTTDSILNIIKNSMSKLYEFDYVTSNHFDIDSFLSTWCIVNADINYRPFESISKLSI